MLVVTEHFLHAKNSVPSILDGVGAAMPLLVFKVGNQGGSAVRLPA